uniref:Major facilitator superfamily (MFS) profile domain-containing protein n=1 Tax=Anopheles atroparvus TaxID=41427 RepID=A0A182J1S0_ANOAO
MEHSSKFSVEVGASSRGAGGVDEVMRKAFQPEGGEGIAMVPVHRNQQQQQLRPAVGNACDADVCDRSNLVTLDKEVCESLPMNGGGQMDRAAMAEDNCTDTDDQNSNYLSISNSRSSSCFDLPGETLPMISARLPQDEEADGGEPLVNESRVTLVHERYSLSRPRQPPPTGVEMEPHLVRACEVSKSVTLDDDRGEDEEENVEEDDEDSSMLTHSAATTATISSNKSRLNVTEQQNHSSAVGGPETSVNIVDNPATVEDIAGGAEAGIGDMGRPTAAAVSANGIGLNQHTRVTTTPSNVSNCSGLPAVTVVQLKQSKNVIYFLRLIFNHCKVLNQTFPDHTFLMNGLVMGIKGILSFLSAPLIGALSDVWGRKFFLLITVFFTCAPIPLMSINSWWFFAMISISGVFAVTFSVVFAYVADVTTVEDRSRAYGLVSATFAASLVISPALGAYLNDKYSEPLIVALATAIAVLDVFFILVAVPESLPEKVRPSSWGAPISWEQADPFAALRKVGLDQTILMQCVTVLLSYLPEAGQYSCIFVYLKLKMHFSSIDVSIFIAVVGILSILAQVILGDLMKMMWAAGILASLASITYPAISAFVSIHSNPDQQGVVQGMVTGMRGLCNGLGPAMFGVIFYVFHVDLNDEHASGAAAGLNGAGIGGVAGAANGIFDGSDAKFVRNETLLGGVHHHIEDEYSQLMPGPPFVFGALMVICAIAVAAFIPEAPSDNIRRPSGLSLDVDYEYERGRKVAGPLSPLMHQDSAQL